MKLLLRRDQKKGLIGGKVTFTLDARADLSEDEQDRIRTYKMGETLLYTKYEVTDKGSGLLGMAGRLAFKAMNVSVTVNDLVKGKHIECKDIVEMCAVEEQIVEASKTFKEVLEAASTFGGEQIVEL